MGGKKGKLLGSLQGGSVLLIRLLLRSYYHPRKEESNADRWTDLVEEEANIFRNMLHSVGTALTSLVSHGKKMFFLLHRSRIIIESGAGSRISISTFILN